LCILYILSNSRPSLAFCRVKDYLLLFVFFKKTRFFVSPPSSSITVYSSRDFTVFSSIRLLPRDVSSQLGPSGSQQGEFTLPPPCTVYVLVTSDRIPVSTDGPQLRDNTSLTLTIRTSIQILVRLVGLLLVTNPPPRYSLVVFVSPTLSPFPSWYTTPHGLYPCVRPAHGASFLQTLSSFFS